MTRIEKQLKRRFPIGSQISETTIVQDFLKQVRTRLEVSMLTCSEIVFKKMIHVFFRNTRKKLFIKLFTL